MIVVKFSAFIVPFTGDDNSRVFFKTYSFMQKYGNICLLFFLELNFFPQ